MPPKIPTTDIILCIVVFASALQVLVYMAQEFRRMYKRKLNYFKDISSLPHMLNLILFLVVWGLRLYFRILMPSKIVVRNLKELKKHQRDFVVGVPRHA